MKKYLCGASHKELGDAASYGGLAMDTIQDVLSGALSDEDLEKAIVAAQARKNDEQKRSCCATDIIRLPEKYDAHFGETFSAKQKLATASWLITQLLQKTDCEL